MNIRNNKGSQMDQSPWTEKEMSLGSLKSVLAEAAIKGSMRQERWHLNKLEMLKRREKGPPRKGQGKKAAKRNKVSA
ncbi:hypothetical protein ACH5RR_015998 [Cinchona calisaya]|uniref:Uncharacterized protein n=1 Tax=Cinchona calisaya TaxID=153742 RepID=A0ABD2ZUR0_9GENT